MLVASTAMTNPVLNLSHLTNEVNSVHPLNLGTKEDFSLKSVVAYILKDDKVDCFVESNFQLSPIYMYVYVRAQYKFGDTKHI